MNHHPSNPQIVGSPRPRRRGGMAMLVVLIVVAMMSLAGLSFVAMLSAENKAIRAYGEGLQMANILASGEEFLKIYLAGTEQADRKSVV